ncbi:uncharacterized protein LOC131635393 [Vicia villosa]|uniref:uncharacterized protein LOC131635393 n=1 Tax=Vicia villosa TaxID=3911 RepID=UPI00273C4542|nr:uncharacterized protein LOC131635393 [Vicia villosa]
MAGRNDAAIAAALEVVAQSMQNQPNAGRNDESRSLSTFQRENLPTFRGKYDPDGAQEWLKEIERIFRVMDFSTAQKVLHGTHMLAGEDDDWWIGTRQRLEVVGEFYLHYNAETAEFSKCIKFENGLRPEIKRAIGYQQIRRFPELVNSCRIYEEDNKAHSAYFKSHNEKKGRNQDHGKPYSAPVDKGKKKVSDGKKTSGGGSPATIKCYSYGEPGHRSNECKNKVLRCYKCGKMGHRAPECKDDGPTCFNCGEKVHISTQCQKLNKDANSLPRLTVGCLL